LEKKNHIERLESSQEELVKHILQFSQDDINKLLVSLNEIHNEKLYSHMLMMQQYYYNPYMMGAGAGAGGQSTMMQNNFNK
jgi:hypothetical protein